MPRAKQPLAEVDSNASIASNRTSNAKPMKRKATEDTEAHTLTAKRQQRAQSPIQNATAPKKTPRTLYVTRPIKKEDIAYRMKDSSVLRRLLFERDLLMDGTREEMIARLEDSSIDYESLPSEQISDMLRERHVTSYGQGSKEVKIERLRLNDKLHYDTGNSGDAVLYGQTCALETMVAEWEAKRVKALTETAENNQYSSWKPARVSTHLEKRKLSKSGSVKVQIARLWNDDNKTINKNLKERTARYKEAKDKLEVAIGHPVHKIKSVMDEANEVSGLDIKVRQQAQPIRKAFPVCEYDWKDSHWASRTERELTEICRRREMPGYGPKAAMLKWLDTGSVDYEDLYVGSLEQMCMERGIKHKSSDKKVELIKKLREADEAEDKE
jgi:hypothetical protein